MMRTTERWPGIWADSPDRRRAWGWFVGIGLALLLLGLCASVNLFVATVATTYYVGALMLVGGVLQIAHALSAAKWGRAAFWFLGGLLYLLAGLAVFLNPLFAAALLTLMLAVSLGLSGAMRLWIALGAGARGRGWMIASAVASMATALIIAIGWPVNSIWVLGLVLSIDLMFQGVALLTVGWSMKAVNAR
jgi:uncharacterized membrane protein HdeD (DUF308 family)